MNTLRITVETISISWMVMIACIMNINRGGFIATLLFKVVPVITSALMLFDVLVGFGILRAV